MIFQFPTYFAGISRFTIGVLNFFLVFLNTSSAQSTLAFPIDIGEGLQKGQITATHTALDIGVIENAFDGILSGNVARSAGISPMIVTLQFNYTFNITATSVYTDNLESGVWSVESANTIADLDNKTGSYQKLVNQAQYTTQVVTARQVSASGKLLRLSMYRLVGDAYVHLGEWGITATANISVTSLCMRPNSVRLIPNSNFLPNWFAADADGNEFPISSGINWNSSNPGVVSVNASGVFASTGNLGEAKVSASWNGVGFQTKVKVVSDFTSSKAEKRVAKVAMIIIDPQIPAAGGQRFSEKFWSYNGGPMALARQTRDSMYAVSGGTVDYQFAEIHDEPNLFTRFAGTLLTVDSIYKLFLEPGWPTLHRVAEQLGQSEFLYNDLLNKYDLCGKSNSHQIDEVWVWAMPFIGMGESAMTGTGAFWINGPVITGNSCTDLLPIMGFNYERYAGCALHNFTHRIETTMYKLFPGQRRYEPSDPPYPPGVPKTPLQTFMLYNALEPGNAHIGNSHFPPNGIENYDYANPNAVPTQAPNWKRYPYLFDQMEQINCSAWGCEGDCGINYCSWWMRHIPHFKCKDKTGRLNSWWPYIVDFNEGKALEAQIDNCNCKMFEDETMTCTSKGDFPWHEWIARVKIHDLDNPSGKSPYSDFSNKTINFRQGGNYAWELTAGFSYFTYDEYFRVWIDKNKNGIFEDAENVVEGVLTRPPDGTSSATLNYCCIPIDFNATPVQGMRMRVSMKRGGYPTACETIPFGEVEDYTVNVVSTAPKPDLALVAWEVIPASGNYCYTPPGSPFLVFSGIVLNISPKAGAGPFKAKAWLSKDEAISPDDVLWQTTQFASIDPGQTVNYALGLSINAPVPSSLAPGLYHAIVQVDSENEVDELDETNNIYKSQVQIGAPDYVLQHLANAPTSLAGGSVLNFSVQAAATTNFPLNELSGFSSYYKGFDVSAVLSTDNLYGNGDDIALGSFAVNYSDFLPTGVATKNVSLQVPGNTVSGPYFLILTMFPNCESVRTNNTLVGSTLTILPGIPGQPCANKSDFPWHEWIGKVKIGSTTQSSGKSPYTDFTGTTFQLLKNFPNSLELTAAYSYSTFDEYWKIWIDYNHNGAFEEPGETAGKFFMARPPDGNNATQTISTTISLPDGAVTGPTLMRVAMKRGDYPTPCETIPYGEVEDYTVAIQSLLRAGINRDETAVGVPENIWFYPNPAVGQLFLNLEKWMNKPVTIYIYNQLEVMVLEKILDRISASPEVLDLSGISNGNYFLKLETPGEQAVFRKLVVARRD